MKKFFSLKLVVVLVIAIVVALTFHKLFWYGRVKTTDNVQSFSEIIIDEKSYTPDELSKGIKLRPGKHILTARGALVKLVDREFSIGPFGETTVSLTAQILSANELAKEVATGDISENYRVSGGALFENNTWLIAFILPKDALSEGYTNIYKFSKNVWELYDSGTGFDMESTVGTELPFSIIEYLGAAR